MKASHKGGKDTVSYYALTKLFEALNPNHRLKSVSRIPDHVQAKDEIFSKFFELEPRGLKFKNSIIVALNLEQVEKAEKAEKPVTKLRKKA